MAARTWSWLAILAPVIAPVMLAVLSTLAAAGPCPPADGC
jgi:hypothetical protein